MLGTATGSLNAKALKVKSKNVLKDLRDENGRFSSCLFLVQTTNSVPSFEPINEKLLSECRMLAEKVPISFTSECAVTEKGKVEHKTKEENG
jgi:hypothetical protein